MKQLLPSARDAGGALGEQYAEWSPRASGPCGTKPARAGGRARGIVAALIGAAALAAAARAGAATEPPAASPVATLATGETAPQEDPVPRRLRAIEASGSLGPGLPAGAAPFVAA